MKSFKFFAAVVLMSVTTIMFSSCSKEKQIEGKWKCTSAKTSDSYYDLSSTKGEVWNFKDNGKCTVFLSYQENKGEDYDGTWSIDGDELIIELEPETYTDGSLKSTEETIGTFEIEELSKNELIISGKWVSTVKTTGSSYADENGTSTYTTKANYEFEPK